jgi:hypothetical protein
MYKSASRFLQARAFRAALRLQKPGRKRKKIKNRHRVCGTSQTAGKLRIHASALKPQCPYCGKLKRGLDAHISAKHSSVVPAVGRESWPPTIQDHLDARESKGAIEKFSLDAMPAKEHVQQPELPVVKTNNTSRDTVKADHPTPIEDWMKEHFQKPRLPGWAQRAASPATADVGKRPSRNSAKRSKSKSECPVCGNRFSRLSLHVSRVHNLTMVECPHCLAELAVKRPGKRKCSACKKFFTVGVDGKSLGIRVECPNCYDDFYIEKLGEAQCPACSKKSYFNGRGLSR